MLTEEKEDYLKAIYHNGGKTSYINNKKIASDMNVKPPSVSEMMARLEKEGYVEIKPYKGAKLSQKGIDTTLKLITRHRLIECFLIEQLKYEWHEVHDEAEVLEHRVSDMFIERLDELLGYPKYCPHGSIIPRTEEDSEQVLDNIMSVQVGNAFVLQKVIDEYEILAYLSQHHVHIGDTITLKQRDKANAVIYLEKEGHAFIISEDNAQKMFVQQKV